MPWGSNEKNVLLYVIDSCVLVVVSFGFTCVYDVAWDTCHVNGLLNVCVDAACGHLEEIS